MNSATPVSEQNPSIFGEVYFHFCPASGKGYVGQTTVGMEERWRLHLRSARSALTPGYRTLICRAIRKYGSDGFEHQVLSHACSQTELDNLEKVWIILLQTKAPTGYNLAAGGYAAAGHVVSPEVRAHLSAAAKVQWATPGFREKYAASRAGLGGSPQAVAAMAAANRGKKQSAETIAKRIKKTTGKKRTQEFRDTCAARMFGKTPSEETRHKMSLAQLARQAGKGKEPNAS
jgi:group I intron endonuclease